MYRKYRDSSHSVTLVVEIYLADRAASASSISFLRVCKKSAPFSLIWVSKNTLTFLALSAAAFPFFKSDPVSSFPWLSCVGFASCPSLENLQHQLKMSRMLIQKKKMPLDSHVLTNRRDVHKKFWRDNCCIQKGLPNGNDKRLLLLIVYKYECLAKYWRRVNQVPPGEACAMPLYKETFLCSQLSSVSVSPFRMQSPLTK